MNLTEAREAFAEALSTVEDLTVRARGPVRDPRIGDGWVTLARLVPAGYIDSSATLTAVVALGHDDVQAEQLLDLWAVQALDAVTRADGLPAADVVLEPVALAVESGSTLPAFQITITTEVEDIA